MVLEAWWAEVNNVEMRIMTGIRTGAHLLQDATSIFCCVAVYNSPNGGI